MKRRAQHWSEFFHRGVGFPTKRHQILPDPSFHDAPMPIQWLMRINLWLCYFGVYKRNSYFTYINQIFRHSWRLLRWIRKASRVPKYVNGEWTCHPYSALPHTYGRYLCTAWVPDYNSDLIHYISSRKLHMSMLLSYLFSHREPYLRVNMATLLHYTVHSSYCP